VLLNTKEKTLKSTEEQKSPQAAYDCHSEGLLLLYFDTSGHIALLSLVPLVSAGSKVCVHVCVTAQA
jgi:hypothetical protein